MLRTVSRLRPRLSRPAAPQPARPTSTIQLSARAAKHPKTATALAVGLVAAALHASSPASSLLALSPSSWISQRRPMSTTSASLPAGGRTDAHALASAAAGSASSSATSTADDWLASHTTTGSLPYSVFAKPLETSPLDDRSYRLLRLPNGLEALLVQDKTTDKAAAAVDVKVGHLSDPRELAGCAHLVEHMKFLGTKKYPKENDYSEFLSANGGSSNAFTGMDNTNYYFDVSPGSLQPALDRFSQFFHSPTFDPSCTERELRAVDSEHSKNLQSDMWRMFQLEKSLSRPDHEYSKFGTGNWETLREEVVRRGKDPREEMMSWWEKNYSAERMKLVVLGKDDLDTLTDWVVDLFSPVPSKDLTPVSFSPDPFGPELLGSFTYMKTVKDFLALELAWPIADQTELFHTKPASFVAHYLGHEGPGSLLSYLKKKGWVNGLGAGASEAATGFSFFRVNLDLTPEGYENYEAIVQAVFAYLRLLSSAPPASQAQTFDECATLASLSFQFAEKSSSPADDASDLASQLSGPWPKDWVLSQQYLMRSFDEGQVRDVIRRLADIGEVKGMLAGQKLPKSMEGRSWDKKEKVYGTEYLVEKFSEQLVKAANSAPVPEELALPQPNEFIPKNVDVKKIEGVEPKEVPALIADTPVSQLWWKKDDRFWVPRANFWVGMRSPLLDASPLNAATARLFTDLFRDFMSEETYAAELAGLKVSVMYSGGNIILSTSGYNDRLGVLMKTAVEKLKAFEIDPERFELLKDDLKRDWSNHELSEPYNYANFFGYYLVEDKMYPPKEKLAVFDQITVESMSKLAGDIFKRLHITTLVHGNMEKEAAVELQKVIEDVLQPEPLTEEEKASDVSLFLPEASAHVWQLPLPNKVNPNSGIDYYLQVGPSTDDKLRALAALFAQVAHEPCFDTLRTKQQLGYLVSSGGRAQSGMVGFHILVQSQNDSVYLENCIEAFLTETMADSLAKMTADEFERHKQSLIDKKLQKVKNLYEESSRLWRSIGDGTFDFGRRNKDAEILKTLTKAELVSFYETYVNPASTSRRKASVHIRTQMDPSAAPVFDVALAEPVVALFTTHAVPADEAALTQLLASQPAPSAVQTFFREALAAAPESVGAEAQEAITKTIDALDAGKTREKKAPVWDERNIKIDDIKLWKQGLAKTEPAKPVAPLDTFRA